MFKFLAFLLSFAGLLTSTNFFIEYFGYNLSIVGTDAESEALWYLLLFVLSVFSLLIGTTKTNKKQQYIFLEQEQGVTRIEKKVLIRLTEEVLKTKKEIENSEVIFEDKKEGYVIRVKAEPVLNLEFAMMDFANETGKEIKNAIQYYASVEIGEVDFEFVSKKTKKGTV